MVMICNPQGSNIGIIIKLIPLLEQLLLIDRVSGLTVALSCINKEILYLLALQSCELWNISVVYEMARPLNNRVDFWETIPTPA